MGKNPGEKKDINHFISAVLNYFQLADFKVRGIVMPRILEKASSHPSLFKIVI